MNTTISLLGQLPKSGLQISRITNFILIAIIMVLVYLGYIILKRNRDKTVADFIKEDEEQVKDFSEDYLLEYVKMKVNEYTRDSLYDMGLTENQASNEREKRKKFKKALKQCMYGSILDKNHVKYFLYRLLQEKITQDDIDKVISFERVSRLSPQDKFEILLYIFKNKKGYESNSLKVLIQENNLDAIKYVIEDKKVASYVITAEEIDDVFKREYVVNTLSYKDKLDIITQRIYQRYKGLGVVDEIRDMNIDGVSGGVSGKTVSNGYSKSMNQLRLELKNQMNNTESVWVMLSGKTIHLSFLSFNEETELKRICQNIYRYNKAGQLTEKNGYRVADMADGSRVVAIRPPFSESWSFFVRKFSNSSSDLETLLQDENSPIVIKLIEWLNIGQMVTAVTGPQGSGKTTLMMAMIKSISATLTLRVQEMAFELNLRAIYPERNILTFRETETISGQEGLDLQKKTDGSVNIIGEVASHPVAAWVIQAAQVASEFTIFSHHAKTTKELILALRNSLLAMDIFDNEKVAEEQVASVLNFNIHLFKDKSGKRYIKRITEIINIEQEPEYTTNFRKHHNMEERMMEFMETMTEYFQRQTDRQTYQLQNIIEFREGRYEVVNTISESTIELMKSSISDTEMEKFEDFLSELSLKSKDLQQRSDLCYLQN